MDQQAFLVQLQGFTDLPHEEIARAEAIGAALSTDAERDEFSRVLRETNEGIHGEKQEELERLREAEALILTAERTVKTAREKQAAASQIKDAKKAEDDLSQYFSAA